MRSCLRAVLAGVLTVALVAAPLPAAASQPLGVVLHAYSSRLSGTAAATGATLFSGDILSTGKDGGLRVRLGEQQLYLLASSSLRLDATGGAPQAQLRAGAAGFASADGATLSIVAADAVIRPAEGKAATGEVKLLSANEILVTSHRGALSVEWHSESITVPEGKAYHLSLNADNGPQEPKGVGTERERRRRVGMVLLGVAIAGGIIAAAVVANTDGRPAAPVSPVVP
ncbi:MAG TPA: hypothetical protein VGA40_06225 [Candidatus Acidoferrales bacterium]